MCGILAALGLQGDARENRVKLLRASKQQRSRGPDATSVYASPDGSAMIAFERLNIVDVTEAGRCGGTRSFNPRSFLRQITPCTDMLILVFHIHHWRPSSPPPSRFPP